MSHLGYALSSPFSISANCAVGGVCKVFTCLLYSELASFRSESVAAAFMWKQWHAVLTPSVRESARQMKGCSPIRQQQHAPAALIAECNLSNWGEKKQCLSFLSKSVTCSTTLMRSSNLCPHTHAHTCTHTHKPTDTHAHTPFELRADKARAWFRNLHSN